MVKRRKRLDKGIASIEHTITIHEQRRERAHNEGNILLADYLDKEVEALKKRKENREQMRDKS